MDKKKRFTLDDYADMIFGITTKKKIPNNIKSEIKGVWNGGTTNKKKKKS
tara:strand:- start:49 stop:198 length:150 start_codon:yes stop_codon:yes gene_type:complete